MTHRKRKNNIAIIIPGLLMLVLGMGFVLASMQEGYTSEEMLARLDEGEQGYFEPISLSQEEILANALATREATQPTHTLPVATQTEIPATLNTPVDARGEASPAPTPTQESTPTTAPTLAQEPPIELIIPKIGVQAPVIPVQPEVMVVNGQEYRQWAAPDELAVGWHSSSAMLSQVGNTVLNGHNNIYGEVFRRLTELQEGDLIIVRAADYDRMYIVTNTMIIPERGESLETRIANARWIQPSEDERLTLISCWPYESNSHRAIVVAVPLHR